MTMLRLVDPATLLLLLWCSALITIASSASIKQQDDSVTVITDFELPEDLLDIVGTPYLLVNNYNDGSRKRTLPLALLDTNTLERVELAVIPTVVQDENVISIFANPTCQPLILDETAQVAGGDHGIDGRPIVADDDENGDGLWEIAVVNHFRRESIEFYRLDPSAPSLTSFGCTLLPEGDVHNNVSYDKVNGNFLAVTLYFEVYYGLVGLINLFISFYRIRKGGNGGLKLIRPGGQVTQINDDLNGANGVLVAAVDTFGPRIFVAESSGGRIREVDASTGDFVPFSSSELENVFRIVPDNLIQDSDTSFLVTRIDDTPILAVAACFLGLPGSCGPPFSVLRYDWESDIVSVVYFNDSSFGLPSVALIKDDVLYVGNSETKELLIIREF